MSRTALNRLSGLILVVAVVTMSSVAAAYIPSKQYGAFELKFGPYRPAVDENPSLTGTPYARTFGDDTMFLTSLELDWQFIHPPGFSLAVGGSWGFMQEYAKSFLDDGVTRSESDYTVLNVMPFAVLFVLRIDALPEYVNVPLAPYFKIGINWYLWWAVNGGEIEDTVDGRASGGTLGWQFSPGLAIELDSLDRTTARTFDNEVGVNHSYLFVEFLWAYVDRFGNDDYLNLSTNTFANATVMAGLCLEF